MEAELARFEAELASAERGPGHAGVMGMPGQGMMSHMGYPGAQMGVPGMGMGMRPMMMGAGMQAPGMMMGSRPGMPMYTGGVYGGTGAGYMSQMQQQQQQQSYAGQAQQASTSGIAAAAAATGKDAKNGKQEPKKKGGQLRVIAGERWRDPTLDEWPENDFRIFVGDLGHECTDDMLAKAFQKYPSFAKSKVVRDKRSSKSKGYGFVSFLDVTDGAKALREMQGKYIGNRPAKLSKSTWDERSGPQKRKDGGQGGGHAKKAKA